jgi:hypothetical protein
LPPFEFLEHVLDNHLWPADEAKLMLELKELVISQGRDALETTACRREIVKLFREMGFTRNYGRNAEAFHRHFPDFVDVERPRRRLNRG